MDEKDGCTTSALSQENGGKLRPVACFSFKLDPVAAELSLSTWRSPLCANLLLRSQQVQTALPAEPATGPGGSCSSVGRAGCLVTVRLAV